MFQTHPRQDDIVMQPTLHLNTPLDTSTEHVPQPGLRSSPHENSGNMYINIQEPASQRSYSSGTCTPISTRSSSSYASNVSSTSTSTGTKRSSMKSSLKSTTPSELNQRRRASPPTVRFADPEPLPRPKPTPVQQQRHQNADRNGIPNPMLQYRHRPVTVAGSASSGLQAHAALPPRNVSSPHLGQLGIKKTRVSQRFSAPVQPSRPDPRWSGIPLPSNFTPPSEVLEKRVSSFQSITSNSSIQSAPAVLQSSPTTSPPSQYNPLDNYIPCLHATCTTHYSPTQTSPSFYLPQGPYSLAKHHTYCPPHASQELKQTAAQCKREWESLRQNAGRKTLGDVASDFDFFLQAFRRDREGVDGELQRAQRRRVLGAKGTHAAEQYKPTQKDTYTEWDWKYTPRHCTRANCTSNPYSPFANHLFAFYHSPRSSSFIPLPTLCPPCAETEVETFERYVGVKWGSRCGWEEGEWGEWVGGVVGERDAGRGFWEGAQERVVRERGPMVRSERGGEGEERGGVGVDRGRKRGFLRKIFGGGG